jgi:hypothetical protein
MKKDWVGVARLATALTIGSLIAVQATKAQDAEPIIHDAILRAFARNEHQARP